jgi:hypothetical protein
MHIQVDGVLFDYNPSPFGSQDNQASKSAFKGILSRLNFSRTSKAADKVENKSVAEQMTKS